MGRGEVYKTNPSQNSNKKLNDAYFTPNWLVEKLFNIVDEKIGKDVRSFIEPSAGNGVWLKYFNKPYSAYDINPKGNNITKADFLSLDIKYQRGLCLIGNPPFGRSGNLAYAFVRKGLEIADYVAMILPASQHKNDHKFWQFDLLHSEHLGNVDFDGHKVNCCFNIYGRTSVIKERPTFKLNNIRFEERLTTRSGKRNSKYSNDEYNFRICMWGAFAGQVIEDDNKTYAKEVAFWIDDKELCDKVYNLFKTKYIVDYFHHTATPNITHWQIVKFIKEHIEE